MRNGLVQHITMEESTSIQWVKVLKMKIVEFSNSVDLDDPEIGGFPFQVFEFAILYSLDQTVFLFHFCFGYNYHYADVNFVVCFSAQRRINIGI